MKTAVLLSAGVLLGWAVLAAPADARSREGDAQVQQRQTQQFVDARMHETLSSIDRSLNTLVGITRGGEPARKEMPIGPTVAGAATSQRPATTPPTLPVENLPADVRADVQYENVLNRTVDVQWNGSANTLLSDMSRQIGFTFSNNNRPLNTVVRVEGDALKVRDVLALVSKQVEGKADIYVSVPNRTLSLVRR